MDAPNEKPARVAPGRLILVALRRLIQPRLSIGTKSRRPAPV